MRLGWQPSPELEFSVVGQNLLHDAHVEFGVLAVRRAVRLCWSQAGWAYRHKQRRLGSIDFKAVFLFNFAGFVAQAFPDAQAPLVIGVLGMDLFGAYLDETVRGETVNNRPLVVQRYGRVEDIITCHILFISRSETDRLERILASLRGRHILTVSDTEGAALRGVMIRLITVEKKIWLRINLEAAQAANLRISSKLLRPAEIVTSGND